jgi:hypothetical protein
VTGDHDTGRLVGAQPLGHVDAEVPKRIDIAAAALFHGTTVDALNDIDLSYTPPFGSLWDVVQTGAQARSRGNALRSGEALDVLGHVPAAAAANPQPAFGRDDRPEPVPLHLVREVAALGQPPDLASIGSGSAP